MLGKLTARSRWELRAVWKAGWAGKAGWARMESWGGRWGTRDPQGVEVGGRKVGGVRELLERDFSLEC